MNLLDAEGNLTMVLSHHQIPAMIYTTIPIFSPSYETRQVWEYQDGGKNNGIDHWQQN
jgi:hypothetical protein